LPCIFHSISSIIDATHAPTISQMIWSTLYHHMTLLVHLSWPHFFLPLPSFIGVKSCSSFTTMWSIALRPPTCPSRLQPVRQAKSCLDLLHPHDSMSCLICNELLQHLCEHCNKSKPPSMSWHELLTQVYLWTNHLCISHLNTLVHLGCHSLPKPN
jgi:hypothetical protein